MRIDVLEKIEKTGSRLEKEALLRTVDNETVRMLKWALDPIITFGVTVDPDQIPKTPASAKNLSSNFWSDMEILLSSLSKREITGHQAIGSMMHVLSRGNEDVVKWACRILNKNLDCGVQLGTFNAAFPGEIQPFACALAKPYDPDKHDIRGHWCVEPKLDGLRMVVINGTAYTRNGRVLETVSHIVEELTGIASDLVFDGEIMGSVEFNEDSGKIRKKGSGPNLSLVYNIFDAVKREEWEARKTVPYGKRRESLEKLFVEHKIKNSVLVKSVKMKRNPTAADLFELRDEMIKLGYEGAMIKDCESEYIFKRSDAILKLKDFKDADGTITGTFEGRGKYKRMLGGIIASFDGVETRIGSGFSDEQRVALWNKRDSLIGKMIEAQYQEKTPDGALRFPVFIRFRIDKE